MCFISSSSFSSFFSAPFAVIVNRPFLSCLKPLFQSEAKCQAIVMKMFFFFFRIQIKFIFTTEVLPLASFCKWEELGNGLFLSVSSRCFSPLMILWSFAGSSYIVPRLISLTKRCVWSLCGELLTQSTSYLRRIETIAVLFSYLELLCMFFVPKAFAWRLRVRGGELRGNLVIFYPRTGAVLVVAAV